MALDAGLAGDANAEESGLGHPTIKPHRGLGGAEGLLNRPRKQGAHKWQELELAEDEG